MLALIQLDDIIERKNEVSCKTESWKKIVKVANGEGKV